MDIDTDKFKSTHIKIMQKELKSRHDKIQQLNLDLKVLRMHHNAILACLLTIAILYLLK